jgi:hypothetical protein
VLIVRGEAGVVKSHARAGDVSDDVLRKYPKAAAPRFVIFEAWAFLLLEVTRFF